MRDHVNGNQIHVDLPNVMISLQLMILLVIHYFQVVLLMVLNVLMVLIVLHNLREHNQHAKAIKPNVQMILMQLKQQLVKQKLVMIHISNILVILIVVII